MLDEKDIQVIRDLMAEQEARLTAKIEDQETRLTAKIEEAQKSAVKEAVELSTRYMNVLYETKIEPQFRLLAEGHQTLLETLAPKDRVEALEEDVAILKTAVSSLSSEVKELKKAI